MLFGRIRRVYEYEPQRTPFGQAGWARAELPELSKSLVCCTDTCWSATRHAKAVVYEGRTLRNDVTAVLPASSQTSHVT